MTALGRVAAEVGKGLAAGLVGTAAMTVSSTLEARIRGREGSNTPARALQGLLHVEPTDKQGEQRLALAGHWGYGTSLGGLRGLLSVLGLRGAAATGAHLGVIWSMQSAVLPATGAGMPAWTWSPQEVAVDIWHHAVYAVAAGLAYEWLDRH